MNLAPGDTVHLRGGGSIAMTVEAVRDNRAHCVWFKRYDGCVWLGKVNRAAFDVAVLVKSTAKERAVVKAAR